MKSAREMFEELGYKLYNKNIYLEYVKEEEAISFYINEKTFCKCNGYEIGEITLEELQAINKQVEELQWTKQTILQ